MFRFVSPASGDIYLDDLRIAIINSIASRQTGAGFLLRIKEKETESVNYSAESKVGIQHILEKFALPHDHIVYQDENINRYKQLAASLLEQGKAFVCTCIHELDENGQSEANLSGIPSRCNGRCYQNNVEEIKRIKNKNIPYVIRIHEPDSPIIFNDLILGKVTTSPHEIGQLVILKPDKTPTNDFVSAVDDMLGGITQIIDGIEHLHEAPRHIHIKKQMGYTVPISTLHLPTILTHQNERVPLMDLLKEGFLPDAIINYLLIESIETPKDVFTLPEAVEWFDLRSITDSSTVFDIEMLRLLNRKHLEKIDDKSLSSLYGFADTDIGGLVRLYLQDIGTLQELDNLILPIFAPKPCEGDLSKSMKSLSDAIENMPMIETFDTFKKNLIEKSGLADRDITQPLRLLITGTSQGPDLEKIYPFIKSYITEVARCPH